MIDFRYHLVSIIAIFLALALGIVVGTTALNGPVLDGLKGSVSALTGDKRALESSVQDLRRRTAQDDEFTQATAPRLLRSALRDERVLLLSTPDAPGNVRDGLAKALVMAGATVTADLRMRPGLIEAAQVVKLEAAVTAAALLAPDPARGSIVERASAQLTTALIKAPNGLSSSAAAKVVKIYTDADLLDRGKPSTELAATMVLVLTGPAPDVKSDPAATTAANVLTYVKAFSARAGVVLAGPATSTDPGAVIRALRDGDLDRSVSSVDDADTPQGQVAAMLALAERAAGLTGSYGVGDGATATAPQGAPAP